jgi:hypothetical protein
MMDETKDKGGAAGGGGPEWIFPITLSPAFPSGDPPSGRKVVEALHLEIGTYRVSYDQTPSGPSAYRQTGRRWVNRLFVIAATGEEVNRTTIGEGEFDSRSDAYIAFGRLSDEQRSFILPRAASVIFIPILGPRASEGELRVRLTKIT